MLSWLLNFGKKKIPYEVSVIGALGDGMRSITFKFDPKERVRWGFKSFCSYGDIEAKFYGARYFAEGLAPVMNEKDKWGFIDLRGKWVIKPIFDDAFSFHEGRAKVRLGDSLCFINREGEIDTEKKIDEKYSSPEKANYFEPNSTPPNIPIIPDPGLDNEGSAWRKEFYSRNFISSLSEKDAEELIGQLLINAYKAYPKLFSELVKEILKKDLEFKKKSPIKKSSRKKKRK